MRTETLTTHPLASLSAEDLDLIVRLVLRSGSLKDLAKVYGVSYPTIRTRVDKVIARLQAAVDGRKVDPLSDLLAGLVENGELSARGARSIQEHVRANTATGAQAAGGERDASQTQGQGAFA